MENREVIVIQPYGGICNRMRAILSAVSLAKKMETNVEVRWLQKRELNAAFSDLFAEPKGFKVKCFEDTIYGRIKEKLLTNDKIANFLSSEKTTYLTDAYLKANYCKDFDLNEHNLLVIPNSNTMAKVFIHSCRKFYPHEIGYSTVFEPAPKVIDRVAAVIQAFSSNTLGIHIRRTDNTKSISHSKDQDFKKIIEREIDRDNDVRFFLSTDHTLLEDEFKRLYGKRIVTYSNNKRRNSSEGIVQAVVDLYSLSRTRKIYGSYGSTFSLTASEIGGAEFEVVNSIRAESN